MRKFVHLIVCLSLYDKDAFCSMTVFKSECVNDGLSLNSIEEADLMLNAHFLKILIPLCCPGSNEASLLNNKIHFGAWQICILFVFSLCIEVIQ